MTTRRIVTTNASVQFNGLFRYQDIDQAIREAVLRAGFRVDDLAHTISAKEKGKDHSITYMAVKDIGRHRIARTTITLSMSGVIPVQAKDGQYVVTVQKGDLSVAYAGIILTEREWAAFTIREKLVPSTAWMWRLFVTRMWDRFVWNALAREEADQIQDLVFSLNRTIELILSKKHYYEVEKHG